jgi:glycogen operon protein
MVFLNGDALRARDTRGRTIRDDTFVLLFNAHVAPVTFIVPGDPWGQRWVVAMDTSARDSFAERDSPVAGGTAVERPGLSLQVIRRA